MRRAKFSSHSVHGNQCKSNSSIGAASASILEATSPGSPITRQQQTPAASSSLVSQWQLQWTHLSRLNANNNVFSSIDSDHGGPSGQDAALLAQVGKSQQIFIATTLRTMQGK